jgi:hypothetical protein
MLFDITIPCSRHRDLRELLGQLGAWICIIKQIETQKGSEMWGIGRYVFRAPLASAWVRFHQPSGKLSRLNIFIPLISQQNWDMYHHSALPLDKLTGFGSKIFTYQDRGIPCSLIVFPPPFFFGFFGRIWITDLKLVIFENVICWSIQFILQMFPETKKCWDIDRKGLKIQGNSGLSD